MSLFLCVEVRLVLGGWQGLGDEWYDIMYYYPTSKYYVHGFHLENAQFIADLLPEPGFIHVPELVINQDFEKIPDDEKFNFKESVIISKRVSYTDERNNIQPHTETEAKQILADAIKKLNELARNKLNL